MDKMKRLIWIIVIIAITAGAVFLFGNGNRDISKNNSIKIGVILPLSGELAFLGEEVKKGIDVAVNELKNQGVFILVIYEDDQSLSLTATVNAANKLINVDNIDVGMTMLVEESRPVAPLFNAKKIPLLVLWDSNRFIKESGEYIFSNGFSTEKAGELMAEYAYDTLKFKNIAVISHIDPWAEIISESFAGKFKNFGGNVIYNEKFQTDVTDYRTAIVKMKQLNPDAVYFPLLPMNSVRFLTQAKQLGLKALMLTGDAFIQDAISESGDSAEGVYFTNIFANNTDKMIVKYKSQYGKDPLDPALFSFGYDGVMKIVEALRIFPDSLRDGLFAIFGESRSADRIEKIYKVINKSPSEVRAE